MQTQFEAQVRERGPDRVKWELGVAHGEGSAGQALLDEVSNQQRPLPPESRLPRPKPSRPTALSKEFRELAVRGTFLDVAFGLVLGLAFGRIVTSFVNDVLLPPVGQLLGGVNFADLFLVLDKSKGEFTALANARAAGVPVIAYGQCISAVIDFALIGICVLLAIKALNTARRRSAVAGTTTATIKTCAFCCSAIPLRATRCPYCTSLVK